MPRSSRATPTSGRRRSGRMPRRARSTAAGTSPRRPRCRARCRARRSRRSGKSPAAAARRPPRGRSAATNTATNPPGAAIAGSSRSQPPTVAPQRSAIQIAATSPASEHTCRTNPRRQPVHTATASVSRMMRSIGFTTYIFDSRTNIRKTGRKNQRRPHSPSARPPVIPSSRHPVIPSLPPHPRRPQHSSSPTDPHSTPQHPPRNIRPAAPVLRPTDRPNAQRPNARPPPRHEKPGHRSGFVPHRPSHAAAAASAVVPVTPARTSSARCTAAVWS